MECVKALILLLSIFQSIALLLPQDDVDVEERKRELSHLSSSITNEPRLFVIDEKTYYFNNGPAVINGTYAFNITMPEIFDFVAHKNSDEFLGKIRDFVDSYPISSLDDFDNMYDGLATLIRRPLSSIDATSDKTFAEDRLTIKGSRLTRVTKWRSDYQYLFRVMRELRQICGLPFLWLMGFGRVFTIDLKFAGEFNDQNAPEKYVPGSQAFFCVNRHEEFVPAAIYVNDTDIIYTPFDSPDEWLLAKMGFNAAEINVQQFDHFIDCHMVLEPLRVELIRHVSTKHPVYPIVNHHLYQIFAITAVGQKVLLTQGVRTDRTFGWGRIGAVQFMDLNLPKAQFESHDFDHRMQTQGLNSIPGYKYRDDSRAVLKVIEVFLKEYLSPYYGNSSEEADAKVVADDEIQNWAKACSEQLSGFPSEFKSLSSLIKAMKNIIFRASVHHHTMNSDSAWDINSLPYSIPAIFAPLPTEKGVSLNLTKYVCPKDLFGDVVVLGAGFKRPIPPERTHLNSYHNLNLGEHAAQAVENHYQAMLKISGRIDEREKGQKRPFTHLNPKHLPYYAWV